MTLNNDVRYVFSKNLRYYRLLNKLTQEELANKSDLTDKYISDLERAQFSPSLEKLEVIANALNIESYKLLKNENDVSKLPNRLDKLTGTRKSKKIK